MTLPIQARSLRLVAAGLVGAAGLTTTEVADAATTTGSATPSTSAATTADGAETDPSRPQRSDETLPTGTDAERVTAAALAAYPGAIIQRVETDADGVYEAHLLTTDGEALIVQVGADFDVTGTPTHGAHGRGGHGRGGHDGDGTTSSGSAAPSTTGSAAPSTSTDPSATSGAATTS